jgi:hypothetical protein
MVYARAIKKTLHARAIKQRTMLGPSCRRSMPGHHEHGLCQGHHRPAARAAVLPERAALPGEPPCRPSRPRAQKRINGFQDPIHIYVRIYIRTYIYTYTYTFFFAMPIVAVRTLGPFSGPQPRIGAAGTVCSTEARVWPRGGRGLYKRVGGWGCAHLFSFWCMSDLVTGEARRGWLWTCSPTWTATISCIPCCFFSV